MARTVDGEYQRKRENLVAAAEDPKTDVTQTDADAILELCDAFDEDRPTVTKPKWPDAPSQLTGYREKTTLKNWTYNLKEYAHEVDLLDTSTDELNEVAGAWIRDSDTHRNSPVTKGTVRISQTAARIFYRYHDDVGVDFEDITLFESQETGVNPRDMLTPEEIAEIRDAPDHARDQFMVDMLLYTGVRNNALRTLRIKDLDPENGEWHFNTEAEGLKGVYQPQAARPLLGAVASVREWLNYHPYSDDPEAYAVVAKPRYGTPDPHTPVNDYTISRALSKLKDETDIEKPMHPHAMRHNFVTLCKREYDLDDSTVKFLIGHEPDSTVMETTYQHLTGEDHKKKAEVAAGLRDSDDESSLTPDHCDVCGEPLGPNDKACSRCGAVYTPDAKSAKDTIEEKTHEGALAAEDDEEKAAVDAVKSLVDDNPELAVQLIDELSSE